MPERIHALFEKSGIAGVDVGATFQALLLAAPDAIVITDRDSHIVIANNRAEEIFGYGRDELVGKPIELLLPDRLRAKHVKLRAHYIGNPHPRPMGAGLDLVAQRKDGSEFPVEVSLSPLNTSDNLLITAVIRDISQRRKAELALRASQARLSGVLNIAEDAVISVNEEQVIELFNQGAEKIFGYAAGEVLGRPLEILLPERFRSMHRYHIEAFAHSPETSRRMAERREIFGLRKGGIEFPAEASISRLTLPDGNVFTVILRDITEHKRSAELLEQQVQQRTAHLDTLLAVSKEIFGARSLEELLGRALNHALDLVPEASLGAIYLVEDTDQSLALRASSGFSQLPALNIPSGTGLIGRAVRERCPYLAQTAAEWQRLVAEQNGDPHDMLHRLGLGSPPTGALVLPLVAHDRATGVMLLARADGDGPFAADAQLTLAGLATLAAAAIADEHSRLATATLSSQLAHLEEQRRNMAERLDYAESGMLQAARLAAVGQLAASIAHEINNPLYAARNSLYLLEEDLPPDLQSSPYLAMASDQLGRIARIIERMRDFYRPTRGELGEYDLNHLLEETLALAGLNLRHGTIQMLFTPAYDLPRVLCNGDQLRQVFLNLVLNAIEAMPDGGTLTVRTQAAPSVAVVEIQDTGIGIPEEARSRLFEPFWTNKPNGTGLGLSISAHIVTQHGGQIEVDSVPGQGSTFRVVLPYRTGS